MAGSIGRYELVRPLARGGMAEVFLARRRVAGIEKRLVVKRIRREKLGDARFLTLFVREARLSMSLAHQNIVPVFDFGRTGDDVFLAMEFVDGTDLATALATARGMNKAIDPVVAAFIAGECAQALDYAHRRLDADGGSLGIVHRDVTPRNVLLSRAGEVKLVDFGIAAFAGEGDAGTSGTPWYMAPEQARGELVDGRADLFGLGMVLLEAVSGTKPRPQIEARDALEAARNATAPRGLDELPAALRPTVERAVAGDREARFADARALATALDSFVLTERAQAPHEAAPGRRLAAWLTELGLPLPLARSFEEGEAKALEAVTFMDDGAAEIIGEATQNSMAATLGPETLAPETVGPATRGGDRAPAGRPAEVATAEVDAGGAAPAATGLEESGPAVGASAPGGQIAAPPPPRLSARLSLRWLVPRKLSAAAVLGALGLIGGALVLGWIIWRDPPLGAGSAAGSAAATALDAGVAAEGSLARAEVFDAQPGLVPVAAREVADAAVRVSSPASGIDAAPARPPVDAAPARVALRGDAHKAAESRRPEGTAAPDAAAKGAPRRVTIGARPWANFYVDDDPKAHQTPETLELLPGRHRLRFENPELRVVKRTVIEVAADQDLQHVEIMSAP